MDSSGLVFLFRIWAIMRLRVAPSTVSIADFLALFALLNTYLALQAHVADIQADLFK